MNAGHAASRGAPREAVRALVELGPFPPFWQAPDDIVHQRRALLQSIARPVTQVEAQLLCSCFGPDGCHGLARELVTIITTSPGAPMDEPPDDDSNPWLDDVWSHYEHERRRGS